MKFAAAVLLALLATAQASSSSLAADRGLADNFIGCIPKMLLVPSAGNNLMNVLTDTKVTIRDVYLTARQCSGRPDNVECVIGITRDVVNTDLGSKNFDKLVDALDVVEDLYSCLTKK